MTDPITFKGCWDRDDPVQDWETFVVQVYGKEAGDWREATEEDLRLAGYTSTTEAREQIQSLTDACDLLRLFVKDIESECRNELVRGKLQGFAADGPHAALWNKLWARAMALLEATDDL